MRGKLKFIIGGIAGALAITLFLGSALAQTETGGNSNYRDAFLNRVAAILGIDRSQLDSAFNQAANDMITQAENDGKLTADQANRMRDRIANEGWQGGPFMGGPFKGGWGGHHGWGHKGRMWMKGAVLDAAASTLGIDTAALKDELKSGKTLGEIADARGVDRQKLLDAMSAAMKKDLDDAVANGKLTQEQADRMLEKFQSIDHLNKGHFGPCKGKHVDSGTNVDGGTGNTGQIQ